MASVSEDAVEDALNVLVSVTEKSGNLKNKLRKDILKATSTLFCQGYHLRKEFAKLKSEVEDKNKLIVDLEMKAVETNSTLKALQFGVGSNSRVDEEATSIGFASEFKGQRLEHGSFCWQNKEALLRRCGRQTTR